MYIRLFVLFLPDGTQHLKKVEGVFRWCRKNAKWCNFLGGVGQVKA